VEQINSEIKSRTRFYTSDRKLVSNFVLQIEIQAPEKRASLGGLFLTSVMKVYPKDSGLS